MTDKVRGNAKQIVAAVGFAVKTFARLQQAVIRLLQQVVSKLPVAADAREITPERWRRPVVEGAESVLVHGERHVGGVGGLEAFDVGEGHVSHGAPVSARPRQSGPVVSRARTP